jgi:hypothetical protein
MIPIPKFRLGTIFLLFFCYAIGLTINRSALGAIEPTVAAMILIGLCQEIRQLWHWTPPARPPRASFKFARNFAILWRCVAAVLLFRRFAFELIGIALPDTHDITSDLLDLPSDFSLVSSNFPPASFLCVLIVLCNSVERWRPKMLPGGTAGRRTRWVALLAIPLTVFVLLQANFTMYLVHVAIAGIEAAQPGRFRRPGVYITPLDENLLSFWLASLAVLCLLIGAAVLLRFIRRRNFACASLWNLAVLPPLLTVPAIFSAWFFTSKFRQLSPDMFEGGFEAGHIDVLTACALVVVVATIVAHKLARSPDFCDPPIADVVEHPERIPFHQTPPALIVIGLHGLYYFVYIIGDTVLRNMSMPMSLGSALIDTLSEPLILLFLAQSIASMQLCWIRWKHRAQPVPWRLAAMSRPAWYEGFVATLLFLTIGIPTLHAFSFVCWLMPWDIRSLFGF